MEPILEMNRSHGSTKLWVACYLGNKLSHSPTLGAPGKQWPADSRLATLDKMKLWFVEFIVLIPIGNSPPEP